MAVMMGVKFMWVKIATPDVYKRKSSWQVSIDPTEAQKKECKAMGMKMNKGGLYQFKRGCEWASGDPRNQPKVMDGNKAPITQAVGNGSTGNIQYNIIEGTGDDGPYKMFDLGAIQVLDLKVYEAEDGAEFDTKVEEGGDGDGFSKEPPVDAEDDGNPF